jgi:hypothetical protein
MFGLALGVPVAAVAQTPTDLNVGLAAVSLTSSGGQSQLSLTTVGQSILPGTGNPLYLSIGFYQSPSWSVEPGGSLNFISSNGSTLALFQGNLSLPYYAEGGYGHKGVYFAPRVGITVLHASSSGGGSSSNTSQVFVGVGVGYKRPLSERVATRLEVSAVDGLGTTNVAQLVVVSAVMGLSVRLGPTGT